MNYDATYTGQAYVAGNDSTLYEYIGGYLRGSGAVANFSTTSYINRPIVTLTGYTVTNKSGNVGYQCTNGYYIMLSEGWTRNGSASVAAHSTKQAQSLVDQIMQANQLILCNNLLCARYAHLLTAQQQQQVRDLQRRLEIRNQSLQDDNLVQVKETSYPAGYNDLAPYLERLMDGEAIGLAITTWIIISAIVIGAATAAYYTYKKFADEAKQDVQFSKELTKTLTSKLTEEEYQQLLEETRGIVTKKRIFAALGSINWKTTAIIGAGILGAAILVRALLRR